MAPGKWRSRPFDRLGSAADFPIYGNAVSQALVVWRVGVHGGENVKTFLTLLIRPC